MSLGNKMTEQLISELTGNYIDKLFYFCLRKTGNTYEAEDLAQDITLNIITSLRKGHIPDSFSAWVWKIARNRYCDWVQKKSKRLDNLSDCDFCECDMEDESENPEKSLVDSETVSVLRRELAFTSKEYRDIIVPYYIEDKKLKEIASFLNLPEGTVKSKLFYARKKLKEGMNMAREFGKRSYKPEDVFFASSGIQSKGLPWAAVERKIPKNILLEASNNPSTLEQLSIELGIALPYVEEEVELLCETALLKKDGDKHITNFFIQSKECQMSIYLAKKKYSDKIAKIANCISKDSIYKIRELGIATDSISDSELKWWIIIYMIDECIKHTDGYSLYFPIEHPTKGDTWGFVGYEKSDIPRHTRIDHNGSGTPDAMIWQYRIHGYGIDDKTPHSYDFEDAMLIHDAAINDKYVSKLSNNDELVWNRIKDKFVHADENGKIVPDIIVLRKGIEEEIKNIFKSHAEYNDLSDTMQALFDNMVNIFKNESNPILHSQMPYNASMAMFGIRGMCLDKAVAEKWLIPPYDKETTTIGLALHIYK